MPISVGNLKLFLSGGAANADPDASLGGAKSSVEITNASLHNLFDIVSSAEAAAGDVEYRAFYVQNDDALTWQSVVAFIQQITPSTDTSVAISIATEGLNTNVQTIANESTAPAGQTFSSPTDEGSGLAIGNMANGEFIGIWIEWTVGAAAAAANADNVIVRFKGDTPA